MKIETLKKLIELESERHIHIDRFKDSVIQLIDLYESDRDVPIYPIGVPNTKPITPYPFTPITPIPPFNTPNTAPYPLFPPTYIYPNGTPPTNLCGMASSPSINPIITTSNATLTSETSNSLDSSENITKQCNDPEQHRCPNVCSVLFCKCKAGECKITLK